MLLTEIILRYWDQPFTTLQLRFHSPHNTGITLHWKLSAIRADEPHTGTCAQGNYLLVYYFTSIIFHCNIPHAPVLFHGDNIQSAAKFKMSFTLTMHRWSDCTEHC